MGELKQYRVNREFTFDAVCIDLDITHFQYVHRGGHCFAKRGDWLVSDGGDTYVIDGDTFNSRYVKQFDRRRWNNTGTVWAKVVTAEGSCPTIRGVSYVYPGNYIVHNNKDDYEGYVIDADKFFEMYEEMDDEEQS